MKRALLVIDVQNEYFSGKLPVTYPQGSLENIMAVMDAAAIHKIPIVVVQHSAPQADSATFRRGSEEWKLHPQIARRPYNKLIEKALPGSFTGTDLEEWLRALQIDCVTIVGYMTQMCCDTTARQALHLGFQVEFLADSVGTLDFSNYAGSVTAEELQRAVLVTQAMRFSKVVTTGDWLAGL